MSDVYPVELWPSDADISRLDGAVDEATGLPYIARGTGPTSDPPLEIQYNRSQQRLKQILAPWNQGRVVDMGSGRVGVFPIRYSMDGIIQVFEGASAVPIPSNGTWMVFLDASGVLSMTPSWPAVTTSYLPLAEVTMSLGVLSISDARPYVAFSAGKDAALWPLVRSLQITVAPETSNNIDLTIRAVDAANQSVAGFFEIHAWLSDSPTAPALTAVVPDGGISVTTGVLLATEMTSKRWRLITASTGLAVLRLSHSAARSWYLLAQIAGRVITSSEIKFV